MNFTNEEIIGNTLFNLGSTTSTNDTARVLIEDGVAVHGTVIVAEYQSEGRGQKSTIWESKSGENLLMSIVLFPEQLKADKQVSLNIAMSLAVYDLVNEYFPLTRIKWPNDIYVGNKKIAGLLIENVLQGQFVKQSVVGIGINVNQEQFENHHAISMKLVDGLDHDIKTKLVFFLNQANKRYAALIEGNTMDMFSEYNRLLFRRNEPTLFRIGNDERQGVIDGIDELGRLKVKMEDGLKSFNHKEIEFII